MAITHLEQDRPWQLEEAEKHYGGAYLRLAFMTDHQPDETRPLSLLFAVVELVPKEQDPPPEIDWIESDPFRQPNAHSDRIFFAAFSVPVTTGIAWYEQCQKGTWTAPPQGKLTIDLQDHKSKEKLDHFVQEPAWPHLNMAQSEVPMPFVPGCHTAYGIHHLLRAPGWQESWDPKYRKDALSFLDDVLSFDMSDWPELLGSCHIVAPCPFLRDVKIGLTSTDTGEAFAVTLERRNDIVSPSFQMVAWEERPSGIAAFASGRINTTESIAVPHKLRKVGIMIFDGDNHLLFFQTPTPFMRQIMASLNFQTGARRITAQTRTQHEEYEVPIRHTSNIHVGEKYSGRGDKLLANAQSRRDQSLKRANLQKWFSGDHQKAKDYTRTLLNQASRRVLLVDPYFGGDEILLYCPAVSASRTPICILTSREALRQVNNRDGHRDLAHAVTQLEEKGMNSLKVRLMRKIDRDPAIHDRFIVVDDRAWLVGSSFNKLGARGTMIVELPESEGAIELLEEEWAQAKSFPEIEAKE